MEPISPLKIPLLCGLTASGKTALALELGATYPLEVVSADAMMVYKGMDIGTAKPTLLERQAVPHHLIDILPANQDFSVAQWVGAAESAIAQILARGKIPLVVGGTGFYVRALSEGLPSTPASDPEQIARLEQELRKQGLDTLYAELEQHSPIDAQRTQRNPRRVLRALEILRGTGAPPSSFAPVAAKYRFSKVALIPSMPELEPRIHARVEWMFTSGLLEEAAALIPVFAKDGRRATSFQAIGYKQALDYLLGAHDANGKIAAISLEECKRRVVLATRQYAKRQTTWFRAEPNAQIYQTSAQAKQQLEAVFLPFLAN
ncbi:MAG: tRNA (adenosine(37)-N6)-dimethylallyltransferase MiaA [Deinococcales bacterium]